MKRKFIFFKMILFSEYYSLTIVINLGWSGLHLVSIYKDPSEQKQPMIIKPWKWHNGKRNQWLRGLIAYENSKNLSQIHQLRVRLNQMHAFVWGVPSKLRSDSHKSLFNNHIKHTHTWLTGSGGSKGNALNTTDRFKVIVAEELRFPAIICTQLWTKAETLPPWPNKFKTIW